MTFKFAFKNSSVSFWLWLITAWSKWSNCSPDFQRHFATL